MKENDEVKRDGLLRLEAKMANALLLDGLDSLKRASLFEEDFYYEAFFSLSIGIERLLKLIIIYQYRKENQGKLPENKTLRSLKHDINKMVKMYVPELLEKNIYYLILEFMTEFAKKTRYYNLDTLTGKEDDVDPIRVWSITEVFILKKYYNDIPQIEYPSLIGVKCKLSNGTEKHLAPIIKEYEIKGIIQECNVLVFYEIIQILVNKLLEYQGNDKYPNMKEIFNTFIIELKEEEIKKRQHWRKEIH